MSDFHQVYEQIDNQPIKRTAHSSSKVLIRNWTYQYQSSLLESALQGLRWWHGLFTSGTVSAKPETAEQLRQ